MERFKPVKAYAVVFTNAFGTSYALTDFLFDSEEKARQFAGIVKADIIEVLVTPVKKL
jgi:hypothetical protein